MKETGTHIPPVMFTTCKDFPLLCEGDRVLAEALEKRGFPVIPALWDDESIDFEGSSFVMLRANWDYYRKLNRFSKWLLSLEASGVPMENSPDLVRWNLTKEYLLELESKGIFIPKTEKVLSQDDIRECYQRNHWDRAILKPAAGASGYLVDVVSLEGLDEWHQGKRWENGEGTWLAQEYLPEIEGGEISLMFLKGEFSHGVLKKPRPGEFRTNAAYEAQVFPYTPSEAMLQKARKILSCLEEVPFYARVDGVDLPSRGGFCLVELELNEPELFFHVVPEKAEDFADAIVKRIEESKK